MTASSQPKSVSQFIKDKIRMVDEEGDQHHVRRVRSWVRNWMMYRDVHYGDFDRNGNWVQLPDNQTEDLRYTSDFAFYVETKATQWTQSQPELSINPVSHLTQIKAATRHAEKELVKYREKCWTQDFKQGMAKMAMLSTCYFIHTRPKLSDDSVSIPKFDQKQVQGKGSYFCQSCGDSGPANGQQSCPQCGGVIGIKPGESAMAYSPSGVDKLPSVEIDVDLVDPMEIKLDPKCRAASIKTADYMRRERYVRDYEVEAMYPDWSKTEDPTAGPVEKSDILNYKRALEQSVGGLAFDNKRDDNSLLRRQYWFDVKVYRNFAPEVGETFAGKEFKAGEKLGEVFPNGLYIDQINGKHVKLFDENKNKVWVGGVDTIDPTSPYGRGFAGLVNLQEMLDEGVSLGFAYMMRDALGLQIYDPMMLEASDVESTRVGGALPLKPGAQAEGRPISAALINVEHKPLSPFTLPFLQMLDSKMPHAAGGAYDVLGGGAGTGAGADTLGGQNQQLQTAAGMIGPALQLRAQAEVEAFTQYLEHLQKFGSDDHFQTIAGEWGRKDVEAFKACAIRKDITIIPVPNSEIPRTQMDRRADVSIAIQSGLANPDMPMMEGVRKYGLEQLRIPIENDPTEQMRRVGEALLEKMRQAAKYINSIPDAQGDPSSMAQAVAAVAPLVKQRDDEAIPVYKEVFQEYLRSTADDSDPNTVLEMAVEMKMDELEQFDVAMATDRNAKQTMAQAPMAMAQAELEKQSQPDQEDAGQAAQAQADAQTKQKQAETDMEMQSEHYNAQLQSQQTAMDQSEADKQRQHETKQAQSQQKHDLELEKIKAKSQQIKGKQDAAKAKLIASRKKAAGPKR